MPGSPGSLKAGLKLTSDQEKLWSPFETAVRDAAKIHMDQMKAMIERMRQMREMMEQMQDRETGPTGQMPSPVDRLEMMAQRMSERAAALTKVAEAAKPLYASFDNSQKRIFGFLGREMLMMGHHGMGMMSHMRMGMMGGERGMMGGGMMEEGGMGMMGREPDRMNMMGGQSNGDEENSDEE